MDSRGGLRWPGEKKKHSQRITALKCTRTSFPPVISSYCTKADGGRGEQRTWQVASFLERHGMAFASRIEWRRGLDAEVGGQDARCGRVCLADDRPRLPQVGCARRRRDSFARDQSDVRDFG